MWTTTNTGYLVSHKTHTGFKRLDSRQSLLSDQSGTNNKKITEKFQICGD
jgi:hypothetical protein